jgi:hypothetical protein
VLDLPFLYPDTAVTARRLAITWNTRERVPYSRAAGPATALSDSEWWPGVHRVSAIPAFGLALTSDEVLRMTQEADCGWRLAGGHLIGWTDGHHTFERLVTLAERLAAVVAAFPPAARARAVPQDRR